MRTRWAHRCCAVLIASGVMSVGAASQAQPKDPALETATQGAEALRFGGWGLGVSIADGSGLNFVGQNYRNDVSLQLDPRLAAGRRFFSSSPTWRKLSLFARFGVSRAITGTDPSSFGGEVRSGPAQPCSNLTPSEQGGLIDPNAVERCHPEPANRRTDYSDLLLGASLPRFYTIPRLDLGVSSTLRFTVPISAQSRYQTLRTGVTATGTLSRSFLDKRFGVTYGLFLGKNFHRFTSPGLDPGSGGAADEAGANPYSGLSAVGISNFYADPSRVGSGEINTSFSFANALGAQVKLSEKWSADLLYMWRDGFSYGHSCQADTNGGTVDTCRTGDAVAASSGSSLRRRGHRKSQVFSVDLAYAPRDWVTLSLSWVTAAPRHKPDGSFRQGFVSVDYNSFTSVVLGSSFAIEEMIGRRSQPAKQ